MRRGNRQSGALTLRRVVFLHPAFAHDSLSPPAGGEVKKRKIVLAAHVCVRGVLTMTERRSGLCEAIYRSPLKGGLPRMIPKSGVRFSDKIMRTKEGSGAPKGALSNQCPRQARRRALPHFPSPLAGGGSGRGCARLSALTLAALATGFYPDGSAPEPGFPQASAQQVFCPLRRKLPRLSTLRADRSLCRSTGDPEPPGCGLAIPPAGTASRFRLCGMPSGKAPSIKRDGWGQYPKRGQLSRKR